MKFSIPVGLLGRVLSPFKTERQSPILFKQVLLDASKEGLVVQRSTSTVFYQAMLKHPDIACTEPGQIATEYAMLAQIVNTYGKQDTLKFAIKKSKMVKNLSGDIDSVGVLDVSKNTKKKDRGSTKVFVYDTDNLPDYYPVDTEVTIDEVPVWVLKRGLGIVSHIGRGRSANRVQYDGFGVYFQHSKDVVRFTTTDGHRLILADYAVAQNEDHLQAERELFAEHDVDWSLEDGISLPAEHVDALLPVLGLVSDDALVKINYCTSRGSANRFSFVVRDEEDGVVEYRVAALLDDARFPEFRELMFARSTQEVMLHRAGFVAALKRLQPLTAFSRISVEGDVVVLVGLRGTNNNEEFSREELDVLLSCGAGEFEEPMRERGAPPEGKIETGLNVFYMSEVLTQLKSPYVRLGFRSKLEPIAVTPCDLHREPGGVVRELESLDGALRLLSVVMPMNL